MTHLRINLKTISVNLGPVPVVFGHIKCCVHGTALAYLTDSLWLISEVAARHHLCQFYFTVLLVTLSLEFNVNKSHCMVFGTFYKKNTAPVSIRSSGILWTLTVK